MTRIPTNLEQQSIEICRALRLELAGRSPRWMAIDTLAYRLKAPSPQLQRPIYFAKMNGWLETAGVPVHSIALTASGQAASQDRRTRPRQPTSRSSGSNSRF